MRKHRQITRREVRCGHGGAEIRSPKSEVRRKSEVRNPKAARSAGASPKHCSGTRILPVRFLAFLPRTRAAETASAPARGRPHPQQRYPASGVAAGEGARAPGHVCAVSTHVCQRGLLAVFGTEGQAGRLPYLERPHLLAWHCPDCTPFANGFSGFGFRTSFGFRISGFGFLPAFPPS